MSHSLVNTEAEYFIICADSGEIQMYSLFSFDFVEQADKGLVLQNYKVTSMSMLCLDKNHDRVVLGHLGGFVSLWDTSRVPISHEIRTKIQ